MSHEEFREQEFPCKHIDRRRLISLLKMLNPAGDGEQQAFEVYRRLDLWVVRAATLLDSVGKPLIANDQVLTVRRLKSQT